VKEKTMEEQQEIRTELLSEEQQEISIPAVEPVVNEPQQEEAPKPMSKTEKRKRLADARREHKKRAKEQKHAEEARDKLMRLTPPLEVSPNDESDEDDVEGFAKSLRRYMDRYVVESLERYNKDAKAEAERQRIEQEEQQQEIVLPPPPPPIRPSVQPRNRLRDIAPIFFA
jgi:hypothetical protein